MGDIGARSESRVGLWTRAGLSWWELVRRVWRELLEDEIPGRSAELAFYFLLSLFPLLLFLTSIFAHVVGGRADLRAELFEYLAAVIPSQGTFELVRQTLDEVIDQRGLHFGVGLLFSLWASSQAMVAVGRVLDTAYEVPVRRPYWRAQAVALALTLAFALLSFLALVLMFWGGAIAQLLSDRFAFGQVFLAAWSLFQWPVALLFVVMAFELIYNFAPSAMARRPLFWTSPGAAVAVTLWVASTFAFKSYLSHFDFYSWTYGSLGALIILLLWFYLTGFSILVGGEINYEIVKALGEERAPRSTPRRPKAKRSRAKR